MVTKTLKIDNVTIRYSDTGSGTPVLLLHGYLESLEIWFPFARKLAEGCRVICPDIPGHGRSGIASGVHDMDLMASFIKKFLDKISVQKCIMIGHSMGGYIALAFAEKYPGNLLAFSLFHSAPFADNEGKKINRDREIELVKKGRKDLLVNTNIPKEFADINLDRLKKEVKFAKKLARNNPDFGIIALLSGMKERPDRTSVITDPPVPFLWILGKKDNYINYDQLCSRIDTGKTGELFVLEQSGHMGFIEEPELSLAKLREFIAGVGKL
jgi:pimeloyl-ACP methyl ester carboxylesterase